MPQSQEMPNSNYIELKKHYKRLRRKLRQEIASFSKLDILNYLEKDTINSNYKLLNHQLSETVELMEHYGFTEEDFLQLDAEESNEGEYSLIRRIRTGISDRIKHGDSVQIIGWLLALAGLGFVAIGILIVYREQPISQAIESVLHDFYANLGAGAIGTALTVLLLDNLYRNKERREKKASLIVRMKHPDWNIAYQAFGEAAREHYFDDHSLENEDLMGVNFRGTKCFEAKLSGSNFYEANFSGSIWIQCDFILGSFIDANFQGAQLYGSDLRLASLQGTDFRGANLQEVQLLGAQIDLSPKYEAATPTRFSTDTILPDGKKWTPERNMDYFTNPQFPGGAWKSTKWT